MDRKVGKSRLESQAGPRPRRASKATAKTVVQEQCETTCETIPGDEIWILKRLLWLQSEGWAGGASRAARRPVKQPLQWYR